MPTLRILFRLGDPTNPIDRIIMAVTGGREVHAEALFSDDPPICFSAQMTTGVRITGSLYDSPESWYGLDTGVLVSQEAIEWAKAECGQPYDLLDAIVSGFERDSLGSPTKEALQALFCSEACYKFAVLCGLHLCLMRPNPVILANRLKGIECKPCEIPTKLFARNKEALT